MNAETLDIFAGAVNEIANGPKVTGFQDLTANLLRRLSEKGVTLEQCAGRKMLNRKRSTLESHCREYGIRFPDYTPSNMRTQLSFIQRGDFMELTGEAVEPVAKALGIVVTERDGIASCAVPIRAWDEAKASLRVAGYEARKGKAPKKAKVAMNG